MKPVIAAVVAAAVVIVLALPAAAHPLGNFTVNQYSGIVAGADRVEVDYVLDMAEIPTFQARPSIDANGDGSLSDTEIANYARATCAAVARLLTLTAAGVRLSLAVTNSAAAFPAGQAGLLTTRVTCALAAPLRLRADTVIGYQNANFSDRIGWREITVAGDHTTVSDSTAPATTTSARLTKYPTNALKSAPDERSASFHVRPGGPALAAAGAAPSGGATKQARGVDAATRAFSDYVGRPRLSLPVAILAFLLAILLGAIHAFAPGHGKTVMAAYLVGRNGSFRQASAIALTVTATHTAGVLLLGVLVSASAVVAPERLYPWLGALSGGLLVAIGVVMLRGGRRTSSATAVNTTGEPAPPARVLVAAGRSGTLDEQSPGEQHWHHRPAEHRLDPAHHDSDSRDFVDPAVALVAPEPHRHGGQWHTHAAPAAGEPLRPAGMLAMGFVGGLLPSPSALVVLLGAIALHRAWFGVVLVVGYGAGMALTLTGAGLLLVRSRVTIDRHLQVGRRLPALLAFERHLPALTGMVVLVVGGFLTARGLLAIQ